MSNIENVPNAFEFMIKLYEEVALFFKEIDGQLKWYNISPSTKVRGQGIAEPFSTSLDSSSEWLAWAPLRAYKAGEKNEILISIQCFLYQREPQFVPYIIVGVYKFLKMPYEIYPKDWYHALKPQELTKNFETIEEKEGIIKAKLKDEKPTNWKDWELEDFRYFKIRLEELTSSLQIKNKICDRILSVLREYSVA